MTASPPSGLAVTERLAPCALATAEMMASPSPWPPARPVRSPPSCWNGSSSRPTSPALALDPSSTGYGSAGFLPLMPKANLMPAAPDLPNAWVTSIAVVDGKGNGLTATELARTCPGIGDGPPRTGGPAHRPAPPSVVNAMHDCVARIGVTYHEVVTYQPASRYWPLQWLELCVFLAAALLLAGACAWRVRRIG